MVGQLHLSADVFMPTPTELASVTHHAHRFALSVPPEPLRSERATRARRARRANWTSAAGWAFDETLYIMGGLVVDPYSGPISMFSRSLSARRFRFPIKFSWLALCLAASLSWTFARKTVADEFSDIKIIRSLPRSTTDLERAHRSSQSDACERIPESQSLELSSFTTILTERDKRDGIRARPIPAARHSVLSVGLIIENSDRSSLPIISRSAILDYIDKNYVAIQLRVRRDLDRKLYFHHRPLAITAQYKGSKLTQKFEPIVTNTIKDFHSIGVFTKVTERLKPENLRTVVLLFKNSVLKPGLRTGEQFEFAFVRGRQGKTDNRLDTHLFVTTNDRTQVTYLNPYVPPISPNSTSIRGSVVITDFDSKGIYPRESATRSYRLDTRRVYSMTSIDAYCKEKGLPGGIYENLEEVLDALIDEKIAVFTPLRPGQLPTTPGIVPSNPASPATPSSGKLPGAPIVPPATPSTPKSPEPARSQEPGP